MEAVYRGQLDSTKVLLSLGAHVNATSKQGDTVLTLWRGVPAIVPLLLNAGADVNVKNAGGITPLVWAKDAEATDVIELLKKAGAKE